MSKGTVSLRFVAACVLIFVLLGVFAFSIGNIASTSAKNRFMKSQQMLARAQASNIQTFFEDFGASVSILAQSPSVKGRDTVTVEKMDTWVGEWADTGLVRGVSLTDTKGIVRFISNVEGIRDVGTSLADRDYFVWASEQESDGEYFVGTPVISRFGATKGKAVVPVVSPVFTNDMFAGAIVTGVVLEALTGRYIKFVKMSDTDVYVMDSSGDLLYGNSDTNEGTLLTQVAEDILSTGTEGSRETRGYLASYAPISLVNQQWWLVMVAPAQEMRDLVKEIYMRQMIVLPIAFVSLVVVWLLAQKRL